MSRSTREKIIRAAQELFFDHGFHAVGIDQIIARVGCTKSTFYNHFESKEALILDVLKLQDDSWPVALRRRLFERAGDRPRNQLMALFDVLDEVFETKGYNGCLFIRAASEFPMPHHPVHPVVKRHVVAVRVAIRELAGYAGARDPETLSNELLVLVIGAYALAQMGEGMIAGNTAKQMARRLIEEQCPPVTVNENVTTPKAARAKSTRGA